MKKCRNNWIWCKKYVNSTGSLQWCFALAKIFWNKMKKNGSMWKKQTDTIFYSLLMWLLYRHHKWRKAQTIHRFRNVNNYFIALSIVPFPGEKKYPCLLVATFKFEHDSNLASPCKFTITWSRFWYNH